MTAKMMEILKDAGIAKEWHKDTMHRLYIDLNKAGEMYYNNYESANFEWARLNLNRRERDNGKLWVDLETNEIHTKGIYMDEQVISQIMELVAFLTPVEEENTEETVETEEIEETNIWYAVMRDREDTDHGTGSFDQDIAISMAQKYRATGDPDAYVVLIDPRDDHCIDELHDL
jgi:hypothetical protein